MIERTFAEAFSGEWVKNNINDSTNELTILRTIIPWRKITSRLSKLYSKKGRHGKSLRILIALITVSRLRLLSDEKVVQQAKENRYIQYFCNIPDKKLQTFINPSTICTFRKRIGAEGAAVIEEEVFNLLRKTGVIKNDAQLIDSTVLEDNIIYPTDVQLLYKAFAKMKQFAKQNDLPAWWDEKYIKKLWRMYCLAKSKEKITYLWDFYFVFTGALNTFQAYLEVVPFLIKKLESGRHLSELLNILDDQTIQKLRGQKNIKNRIVSLDEVDARPIKKGKSHPSCEFGTTLQISFNRDGFMITTENFIGTPGDKTFFLNTLEFYRERMKGYAKKAVTDLGYRSLNNMKEGKEKVETIFMGRVEDVPEEIQSFCKKARSATEGFIAVAKTWRGFGRSLYKGFEGDKIWTSLSQLAYNLHKFIQLDKSEKIGEESLLKLGLYG
ncbi:MAG: transposase [Candidatus Electrothrix sp. AU1_5]|nr:transposase [Candidatus Electrothrix sp. AX1]MCI5194518.1 transposase [Candidatus Electrothrix gigas]